MPPPSALVPTGPVAPIATNYLCPGCKEGWETECLASLASEDSGRKEFSQVEIGGSYLAAHPNYKCTL